MKKWLILALFSLCLASATACRTQDDSSSKKPATSNSSTSKFDGIELPEDKFD